MSALILASKSAGRQNMLNQCGIAYEAIPADIDETTVIRQSQDSGKTPQDIALLLSVEKAKAVAKNNTDAYVIGSDQILVLDNQIFEKSETVIEAKEKLRVMRGKTHYLYSAYALVHGDQILNQYCNKVSLTMIDFDDDALDQYCKKAGDALTSCAGGYALEDIGVTLFSKIDGDYFTILGMPLLPLLSALRHEGFKI